MVSDDTEHTCMVLQSWITSNGEVTVFQRELASRFKWWLASLPGGTGMATARAILKLWVGFSPANSGVFSAGNGPAMRSAILGIVLPFEKIEEYVTASTRLTHTDPKAKWGALAIALAAHLVARTRQVDAADYLALLEQQFVPASGPAEELLTLIRDSITAIPSFDSTADYCYQVQSRRGVSGYVYLTVPIVIHAWLRNQTDYAAAVEDVIRCGGDADTTAAIVGGIVGAAVGIEGIPKGWRDGLCDWPLSVSWIQDLARAASVNAPRLNKPPELGLAARLARNLVFMAIILAHGFRRLAPPY